MTRDDVLKLCSSGCNYIANINIIDHVEGQNIYLCGSPSEDDRKNSEKTSEKPFYNNIPEISIPEELKPIYEGLTEQKRLWCRAILWLQSLKDGDKYLFRFANDWWGVFSPFVYGEKLIKDPGSFYNLLLELGMGKFRVNCTREQMVDICGVFMKNIDDWKVEDYLNGYGEREWGFWQKTKVAVRTREILNLLHQETDI